MIMNRFYTTLLVLAMLLVADIVCIWQTLENSGQFTKTDVTTLIVIEAVFGVAVLATAATLAVKRYGGISRAMRFEPVRPLRRLLSAVWS